MQHVPWTMDKGWDGVTIPIGFPQKAALARPTKRLAADHRAVVACLLRQAEETSAGREGLPSPQ
jgi:hypothetical protein